VASFKDRVVIRGRKRLETGQVQFAAMPKNEPTPRQSWQHTHQNGRTSVVVTQGGLYGAALEGDTSYNVVHKDLATAQAIADRAADCYPCHCPNKWPD
jgi:hypothetical protein